MSDITANVVVSMPSQLFTMARSFKAVANGKIYIGKIDTDPVNPENQIQVYVENEDGSHVPVPQPIIINAAGYPVYNGQIAKFVTVQGHSMAVYDAYGTQQFYYPNIIKYDPDQFRGLIEGENGYTLIGGLGFRYVDIAAETGDDFEDGTIIIAKYGFETGDLAGGRFTYYSNRNLDPDDGIVINTGAVGQVVRDGLYAGTFNGPLNAIFYGAKPGPETDNAIPINKALNSPYGVEVLVDRYLFIKTPVVMQDNKALTGIKSAWAYSSSGFNLKSTLKLADDHTIGYADPIVDVRKKKQTSISYIDIDGSASNCTCIEYGDRSQQTVAYHNHEITACVFRDALIGLRSDMAGLMRVTLCQFTTLKENGILSRFTLSDSIFIGCYFNDIGYHGETYFDEDDVYDYRGAAVACGPNFGNSFIGGKIEYCRIGVHMVATSWLTMTGMWFDIFKRAAIVAIGDGSGYGVNNIFSSLKINGAGSLKNDDAAVLVFGANSNMDLYFNGTIHATFPNDAPDPSYPMYGPRLAAVKVLNNKGKVTIDGQLVDCSGHYSIYTDGAETRVIDNSISNKPRSVNGGSYVNNYAYDSGDVLRGFVFRDVPDDTPQNYGVGVGALYRTGTAVKIRIN
ncbi:Bifunctional tail protein [Escherichia coli]|uniref:phage head-binding domain-containing protein n=1 Tax=Escherichia coli TaxID=562 RepID=UPI002E190039|nr:phage head-binding domain-containing protein [Escherichia coli]